MVVQVVNARCINCKKPVKPEQSKCQCGDPVAIRPSNPRARIELEPAAPPATPTVAPESGVPSRPVLEDVSAMSVTLTPEQESALDHIQGWFLDGRVRMEPFRLFGPAGTGKTTLIKSLSRKLGISNIVYGAYTGKAAHVMRKKGIPATTIHSAIYSPVDNQQARARWEVATRELAELRTLDASPTANGAAWTARVEALEAEVAELEEAIRHGVTFELNPMSEWADADLIVLDEVSMVNESIGLDIESFSVPILVLGDPFQLPPVEGGGYYMGRRADVTLREIHRQALESPVLRLATDIRTGQYWEAESVNLDAAMAADQILCWKNATRHNLTRKIREKRGLSPATPVRGDRVMCLVNNRELGVFNGQQFIVGDVKPGDEEFLLRDDDGRESWFYYDPDGFRGVLGEQEAKARRRHRGKVGLFTFADVITVHKSQGSEWDSVYVVDQTHLMWRATDLEKRRWMYTAVTRASERVTIASTEVQ